MYATFVTDESVVITKMWVESPFAGSHTCRGGAHMPFSDQTSHVTKFLQILNKKETRRLSILARVAVSSYAQFKLKSLFYIWLIF